MSEYKGYNIESDGTFGMKVVTTVGPGSVPNSLRGSFTGDYHARKAIDVVINSKAVIKGNKNDKANNTSRV